MEEAPYALDMALEAYPGEIPKKPAFWHYPENLVLTFFFCFMMSLPLLDIVGRKLHRSHSNGSRPTSFRVP